MDCQTCQEHLLAYAWGELSPDESAQVEAALAQCPDCRAELHAIAVMREALDEEPLAPLAPFRRALVLEEAARASRERRRAARGGLFSWAGLAVAAAGIGAVALTFTWVMQSRVPDAANPHVVSPVVATTPEVPAIDTMARNEGTAPSVSAPSVSAAAAAAEPAPAPPAAVAEEPSPPAQEVAADSLARTAPAEAPEADQRVPQRAAPAIGAGGAPTSGGNTAPPPRENLEAARGRATRTAQEEPETRPLALRGTTAQERAPSYGVGGMMRDDAPGTGAGASQPVVPETRAEGADTVAIAAPAPTASPRSTAGPTTATRPAPSPPAASPPVAAAPVVTPGPAAATAYGAPAYGVPAYGTPGGAPSGAPTYGAPAGRAAAEMAPAPPATQSRERAEGQPSARVDADLEQRSGVGYEAESDTIVSQQAAPAPLAESASGVAAPDDAAATGASDETTARRDQVERAADGQALLAAGLMAYDEGRYREAADAMRAATATGDGQTVGEARFWLAASLVELNRPEDALRQLREFLRLHPGHRREADARALMDRLAPRDAAPAPMRNQVTEPR